MLFVVVRVVIVLLALWALWKLYLALFPTRQSPYARPQDEWGEVLEAIDELPETTEAPASIQDHDRLLQDQQEPSDGAMPATPIESIMVHEAEIALSLLKAGDEDKRLAAYHEITTYAKLCTISEHHISEVTWKKINDIRRQAREILGSPDKN